MNRSMEVLVRLVRMHDCFGEEVYERAVHRALLAIAQVALEEAHGHCHRTPRRQANVIPFPAPDLGAPRYE